MRETPTTIWQEVTLGQLAKGFRGVSYRPENLLGYPSDSAVTLLRATNIQQGNLTFDDVQFVPKWLVSPTQILEAGDIAVCMSNGSKTLVGKCASYQRSEKDTYTVGAFCSIFKPVDAIDAEFIFHLFRSQAYQKNIDVVLAGSAINNLKNSSIESAVFKIPVDKKQRQKIAAILTSIDTATEKTEALITKYQQIKAGLMHDLFTRGVLPNGQLRPPREQAPELYQETNEGEIPKDWERKTLGAACTWSSGGTPSKSNESFWNGALPWLSPKDMKQFELGDTQDHVTRQAAFFGSRIAPAGTVFIVVRGMILAHSFPVVLSTAEFSFNQDVKAVVACQPLSNRYLAYWFVAYTNLFLKKTTESTHGTKRFDLNDLYKIAIGVPTADEQQRIIERLDTIERRVANEAGQRNKLQTQKLGLMQDLLTGKVAVKVDTAEKEFA